MKSWTKIEKIFFFASLLFICIAMYGWLGGDLLPGLPDGDQHKIDSLKAEIMTLNTDLIMYELYTDSIIRQQKQLDSVFKSTMKRLTYESKSSDSDILALSDDSLLLLWARYTDSAYTAAIFRRLED